MYSLINGYKRFPYPISRRVKFFNVFRYVFTFYPFENFLVSRLLRGKNPWWKKLIPPFYFYRPGSIRKATRDDIQLVLDVSRLNDHSIYFCCADDPAWMNLYKFLKKDFNILDAGANIGYLSLVFAKQCPDGIIYSIEPDSANFNDLSRNLKANRFNNIKVFKTALGSEPASKRLYKLYDSNPGANRILAAPLKDGMESESVDVTTLDIMKAQGVFKKIDLMKIDVEGFELFLLQGATQLIKSWKPILFVELADVNLRMQNCSALELVEFIESLSYSIIDARTMKPVNKLGLPYTDILCFPTDAVDNFLNNN